MIMPWFNNRPLLPALGLTLLLSACGGGGGGTGLSDNNDSPDPGVIDIPIAYIKRPTPAPDPNNNNSRSYTDLNDPIAMSAGAQLIIRPRSSNRSQEIDITPQIRSIIASELGVAGSELSIDIKGLNTSYDGTQLIFSVRAIPDLANNNNPELFTWNLWTYDFATNQAAYVINSALIRDEGADTGGGHDMDPHFLTDDRIIFSSSRQSALQERQLNEGRGQRYSPVAVDNPNSQAISLHIYDPDTQSITQVSTNQTAELQSSSLASGEVVFSLRDPVSSTYSLYKVNPTGLLNSSLYGANSSPILVIEESTTGASGPLHFQYPKELPDGRLMALMLPGPSQTLGGDIALIDAKGFIDVFTPSANYSGGSRGQLPLTDTEVNALDTLSPGGKFLAAYPLRDGSSRILVSWNQCRIRNDQGLVKPCAIARNSDRINGVFVPAEPVFGLWMFDPRDQTQLPVLLGETGSIITEVIAAEPRTYPSTPADGPYDADLAALNQGLLIIDSVYNEDNGLVNFAPLGIAAYSQPGTTAYTNRPARFMRIIQQVPRPNNNVLPNLPGSGGIFGLLEILGYVPVEPDGSVSVRVPANTPLMLNTVRDDGRRISARHTRWIQLAPGEIRRCVGCHDPNSSVPHGRRDTQPPSQNPGAVAAVGPVTGLGFTFADPTLAADALGQTMADVYDLHNPFGDPLGERTRNIDLQILYTDEWTDTALSTPDPDIDLTYDPGWALPAAYPLIVPNLDPSLNGRIVIHYGDHIQAIWDRQRTILISGSQVFAPDGSAATSCVSCHTSNNNTMVPAGQLDLSGGATGQDPLTVSYIELTRGDNEQWMTTMGGVADRTRLCTQLDAMGNPVLDAMGNPIVQAVNFPVPAPVNRGSAVASFEFFQCFEGSAPDQCGRFVQDLSPPPANCTDSGGTPNSGGSLSTKDIPPDFTTAESYMPTGTSLTDPAELIGLLRAHCAGCHVSGGSASPAHSDANNDTAYNNLTPYINLVNPASSTFVFRLETLNHNCWSNCSSDAAEMLAAITSFANAVPATTVTIPGGSTVSSTFDHRGLLSPSELRLISEWIDIGTPFYNNPFDSRL